MVEVEDETRGNPQHLRDSRACLLYHIPACCKRDWARDEHAVLNEAVTLMNAVAPFLLRMMEPKERIGVG